MAKVKVNDAEVLKKRTMTKKAYQESMKAMRGTNGFNTGTRNTDKNGKKSKRSSLSIAELKHKNLRPERSF